MKKKSLNCVWTFLFVVDIKSTINIINKFGIQKWIVVRTETPKHRHTPDSSERLGEIACACG